MDGPAIGFGTAFVAGVISFLSPCVLPIVPGYVSYIAGQSGEQQRAARSLRTRFAALVLSMFFVLGFGAVFVALGAGATALGGVLLQYRYEANLLGGAIVIVFGLAMLGAFRRLAWTQRDFRLHLNVPGGRAATAFVLGVAFGFGWTPCIGPILGAILAVAAVQSSLQGGIGLLTAYALGLGLPFLLAAVFMGALLERIKALRRAGRRLQIVAGVLMVLFGLAMITGKLAAFSYWLLQTFPILGRIG
ncbi:MAG: cytochrome c biogenesis protein CcdA [Pseudomonadota bacterium]|nr:cytochrome c biogenesis protein CcdA [Pseudomonadota bacterium]